MIYVYLFAFTLGGVLLVASIFAGGGDDAEPCAGAPGDLGEAKPAGGFASLSALRSLRFWTFLLAFFGLTGLVFAGLELASPALTMLFALAVGLGTAVAAAAALRYLQREESGALAEASDYIGKPVRVVVPFDASSTGKARLELRGSEVDVLARTDEERAFGVNDAAIIIELDGAVARIARVDVSGDSSRNGG